MDERKVAVVTGGTRGIGRAISLALGAAGVHVAAGYSTNSAAAEATRDEVVGAGGSISLHQGNVGEPEYATCARTRSNDFTHRLFPD